MKTRMTPGINVETTQNGHPAGKDRLQPWWHQEIKSKGFNSVRHFVYCHQNSGGYPNYTLNGAFWSDLDLLVDSALGNNLVCVLVIRERAREDEPDSQVMGGNTPDNAKEMLKKWWEQIATRYKYKSENLLFEILNEPHGDITDDEWRTFLRETVPVIRNSGGGNGSRNLLIGSVWNNPKLLRDHVNQDLIDLDSFGNYLASVHSYHPLKYTHQGVGGMPTGVNYTGGWDWIDRWEINTHLGAASQWQGRSEHPVIVTEWGASNHSPSEWERVEYVRIMKEEMKNGSSGDGSPGDGSFGNMYFTFSSSNGYQPFHLFDSVAGYNWWRYHWLISEVLKP